MGKLKLNWEEAKRLAQQRKDLALDKREKVILVGMGMYRHPEPETIDKVLALMSDFTAKMQHERHIHYQQVTGADLTSMRGSFAGAVLANEEFTHLLFIDDDMLFPVNDGFSRQQGKIVEFNPLIRLLSLDKDMVGALCFSRNRKVTPFVGMETEDGISKFDFLPEQIIGSDPFRVDFIGFGMVLIARRVFEKIAALGYGPGAMFRQFNAWGTSADRKAEFALALDKYGAGVTTRAELAAEIDRIQARSDVLSEDYSFCKLARMAGCDIWCDPSWDCGHFGKYAYGRADWWALVGQSLYDKQQAEKQQEPEPQEA